jgi:hypothetical protein
MDDPVFPVCSLIGRSGQEVFDHVELLDPPSSETGNVRIAVSLLHPIHSMATNGNRLK